MNIGWVKIHRKLLEWEWYDEPNTFRLFIHLLLKANHKPKTYRGVEIKSGEIMTGLSLLAEQTGLTVQKIRTALSNLKSTNEITIKTNSKGSIIQIVKYIDYQVATSEVTTNQQTSNKPSTTNNNDNKEKNEKKKEMFESFWGLYPHKRAKSKCEIKFLSLSFDDIELIMSTVSDFIKHKPFATYTHPNPMTYLNQRRWEDEIPRTSKTSNQIGVKKIIGKTNQSN